MGFCTVANLAYKGIFWLRINDARQHKTTTNICVDVRYHL